MTEYVVHFQKGFKVGARAFRAVYVEAASEAEAVKLAKKEFPTARADGYRFTYVKEA
jgi:hypothetical protein